MFTKTSARQTGKLLNFVSDAKRLFSCKQSALIGLDILSFKVLANYTPIPYPVNSKCHFFLNSLTSSAAHLLPSH